MTRLSKEELEKVKKKYGVERLWSWSRFHCYLTSPYEYFLKYVLGKNGDRCDCAYAPVGNAAHTALEKYYSNEIPYEEMLESFKDEWINKIEIVDLKFDRNDEEKNASIKAKYKEDIEHFFRNHVPIDAKVAVEKFVAAKIGDEVFQGYIDAVYKDNDGNYVIVDFKTSSKFSAKSLEDKSGQLTVYAIALNQLGVPFDKIKICFNMLKYCTIEYQQKNGAIKTRDVERYKIGESLQSNVNMWLKDAGLPEDEIDFCLNNLKEMNSIEVLPDEVKCKYKISDCYVWVPLTQKLIDAWTNTIIAVTKDIRSREEDYKRDKNDKVFWDDEESVRAESYYFATLMEYSRALHKPYDEFLLKLEKEQEAKNSGADLFSGVGSETEETQTETVKSNNNDEDIDLSWLDEL